MLPPGAMKMAAGLARRSGVVRKIGSSIGRSGVAKRIGSVVKRMNVVKRVSNLANLTKAGAKAGYRSGSANFMSQHHEVVANHATKIAHGVGRYAGAGYQRARGTAGKISNRVRRLKIG